MQWNHSSKFRGVILKGNHQFRSIEFLEWRPTVAEVLEDLKKVKGHLTFIRNEFGFSCLPYRATDRNVA